MSTPSSPTTLRGPHPLDFLPFVRHRAHTRLRSLALTSILGMTIGGIISVIQSGLSGHFSLVDVIVPAVVIGNVVGFVIHGGLLALNVLLRSWPLRQDSSSTLSARSPP